MISPKQGKLLPWEQCALQGPEAMGERKRKVGGSEHHSWPGGSCTNTGSAREWGEHSLLKGESHRQSYPLHKTAQEVKTSTSAKGHPATAQPHRNVPAELHDGTMTGQLVPCCHHPSVPQAADPVCTTLVWVQSPGAHWAGKCPVPPPWPAGFGVPGSAHINRSTHTASKVEREKLIPLPRLMDTQSHP